MPRPEFNKDVVDRNTWLKTLSLETLRELAKQRGISNYQKMTEKQLVDSLTQLDTCVNPNSTRKLDHTIQ